MRTKTLLLTAAVIAAGVASSMAQSNVYSLNIVGYVNVPVQANKFYLLSNPFDDGAGDSINSIMSSINTNAFGFDGSSAWTFSPTAGYSEADYNASSTTNGSWALASGFKALTPGTGFWFLPAGSGTVTFTGSVVLASTNTIAGNNNQEFSLIGSAYPAQANLVALGLNWLATGTPKGIAHDGDAIFRWNSAAQSFTVSPGGEYDFNAGSGWAGPTGDTNGPVLNVAEGIFYENVNNTDTWVQNFSVN
jgi:hypothetical protein